MTDNHASTSSLSFYRLGALSGVKALKLFTYLSFIVDVVFKHFAVLLQPPGTLFQEQLLTTTR